MWHVIDDLWPLEVVIYVETTLSLVSLYQEPPVVNDLAESTLHNVTLKGTH